MKSATIYYDSRRISCSSYDDIYVYNLFQNRQYSPSSRPPKFLPGQSSPSSHHPTTGSATPSRSPARPMNPSLSKQHPQSSTVSLTPANSHENVIL